MMHLLAAIGVLRASALLAPTSRLRPPSRLGKGAFPELEFAPDADAPRRSLRGLWRLRRDCEGEVVEVVVSLKASGAFESSYHPRGGATAEVAARGRDFAGRLRGRWYSDSEDRELRIVRFERKSPVEWYTGAPVDGDSSLGSYAGHVTYGASEPEWIGRFQLAPLWPETHAYLPAPPAEAPAFAAPGVAGAWVLLHSETGGRATAYDVALYGNLTWETRNGFEGSGARREAGVAARPSLAASRTALDGLLRLERANARDGRADRAFLAAALGDAAGPSPEVPAARLAGTWNVCEDEDAVDFFSGLPGRGRHVFLWCRRFGTGDAGGTSGGVTLESDLLFSGLLEGDDDDAGEATAGGGVSAVGWSTEPYFVGTFALARAPPPRQ